MDGALLKSKRQQAEMKRKKEGGGGPLQFNRHIFSLIKDIIYTNPLKRSGAEHAVPTPSEQPVHFFFLVLCLSISLSVCRCLCPSVSLSKHPILFIYFYRTHSNHCGF